MLLLAAFYMLSFCFSGLSSIIVSVGFSLALLALGMWVRSDWDDQPEASQTDDQVDPSQAKSNASQHQNSSNTSALTNWKISMLLKARRNSYDSQNTAV